LKTDKELIPDSRPWWYYKDYLQEGIPGISLDKWYSNKRQPTSKSIIVAVIDTQIDLNHEDLQGQIWTNLVKFQNGIDDHNGYTDDINGWNFTSNKMIMWFGAISNILEY
jgi:subtilisin family serine protease